MIARLKPRAGQADRLRTVLEELVEPTRGEDGCITYNLHETETAHGTEFVFYETWRSERDHAAHMRTAHIGVLLSRQSELVDGEIAIEPLRLVEGSWLL